MSDQDFIEYVHCRSSLEDKGHKWANNVVIKVRHMRDKIFLIQYVLSTEKEVTWLSASRDTEVFLDGHKNFMAADPEVGIIDLRTKEVMYEYHIEALAERRWRQAEMCWGSKLVQSSNSQILIGANSFILPYSLLSVVQHA